MQDLQDLAADIAGRTDDGNPVAHGPFLSKTRAGGAEASGPPEGALTYAATGLFSMASGPPAGARFAAA